MFLLRWQGDGGDAAEHSILVPNDPPGELERAITVIGFRRRQHRIQNLTRERGGGCVLERTDQIAGGDQALFTLVLATDIG